MPNVKSIINTHNRNILHKCDDQKRKCNCINKDQCPIDNECLSENSVYQATVAYNSNGEQNENIYIGISEGTFKKRYANHKKSFAHEKYRNETELSNLYWQLKDQNIVANISWKFLFKCPRYTPSSSKCFLCTNEKLAILEHNSSHLINKRSELTSKCRHRRKFKLCSHRLKS